MPCIVYPSSQCFMYTSALSSYNHCPIYSCLLRGAVNVIRKVVVLGMLIPLLAYAQGNTFDKVRYNGGSISTTVKPDEWGNKLNVTSGAIVLTLKDGQSISINPK